MSKGLGGWGLKEGWGLEGAGGLGGLEPGGTGRTFVCSFARSGGRKLPPSVLYDIVPFGSAAQKGVSGDQSVSVRRSVGQSVID